MPKTFEYVALDRAGQRQSGQVLADDEAAARLSLSSGGYLVEVLTEKADAPPLPAEAEVDEARGRSVNLGVQQLFFSQLASLVKSGVPLVQALNTLANSQRGGFRDIVFEMASAVQAGNPISDVIEAKPREFSPLVLALVRAGEHGGFLDRTLRQVSDYQLKEIRLRNRMRSALFYPKILLLAMLFIPLIANLITGYITSRNGAPQLGLVNLLTQWWFLFPFVSLLCLWLVFYRILLHRPNVRLAYDKILLSVPYVGPTVEMQTLARFARSFGALYEAGVPIARSTVLAAEASGNKYLGSLIESAAPQIQEGAGIADAFSQTKAFSPIALDMLRTGEATGNLEPLLQNLAEQYEGESDVRVDKMATMLPVVILLISGVIVGFMVISFYSKYASAMMSGSGG
jgi:type IV pilus assembly protein PilC